MSQSANSTNNIHNKSFASPVKTFDLIDKQEIKSIPEHVSKRVSIAIADEEENEMKKAKTSHPLTPKSSASVVPKFVTAKEFAVARSCQIIQEMPEISDAELLDMALKFEKNHPQ